MQTYKNQKIAAIFLLTAVMLAILSGCATKSNRPEDTITHLQDAINTFDTNKLLQYVDNAWDGRIEAILSCAICKEGASVGSILTMVKNIMPILPATSDGAVSLDDLPQVELTVLKTDIAEETAVVDVSGILIWGEYTKPFTATVEMELENDVWVVCGVS